MKINKKFVLALAALGIAFTGFADDWDMDMGDDTGSSSEPSVTVGGAVEMNARAYVDQRDENDDRLDVDEWKTAFFPKGLLNFNYSGLSSDVSLSLKLDKTSLYDGYYWDILDEFTARAYVGNAQFEAGKMRVVWGKGDKLHVLDNFNANDYTDYIIPDYIDRRISEPMFRAVYSTNSNVKFEAVYTPVMTADRLADDGVWQPKAAKTLKNTISTYAQTKLADYIEAKDTAMAAATLAGSAYQSAGAAYSSAVSDYQADTESEDKLAAFNTAQSAFLTAQTAYENAKADLTAAETDYTLALSNASALNSDSSSLYPDTYQLKYGQAGLRTTFTVGAIDLGLSYYYGHLKQPTFDLSKFMSAMDGYLATGSIDEDDKFLSYNQVQIFGLEGAGILFGHLNSRFEVAYNMTNDIDGDDAAVPNNSVAWVAGFDVDLPIHNINFNVQETGKYILNSDKIEDNRDDFLKAYGATAYKVYADSYDVDYNSTGYTNNKIVVDITDNWNHEKIKLDLKGIYGIERGDLLVMPTLTFIIKDDFDLNLSGLYIWCKDSDSEFDGWEHNSFAQIGVKYQF